MLAGRGKHDMVPEVYQEHKCVDLGKHDAALVDLDEDELAGNSEHDELPVEHVL